LQNGRFHPPSGRQFLAAAGFSLLILSGCTTTKKVAEAPASTPRTTIPESLKRDLAKGGTTASNVPQPSSGESDGAAQVALAAEASTPAPEAAFPPAPEQPPQNSMAGLATQPTGVRAGSGTIFSAAPPVPAAADPSASGPVPANLPRRNFNAMAASVYSAPQAVPAAGCSTGSQSSEVSC
jgi:hypothetical protein